MKLAYMRIFNLRKSLAPPHVNRTTVFEAMAADFGVEKRLLKQSLYRRKGRGVSIWKMGNTFRGSEAKGGVRWFG